MLTRCGWPETIIVGARRSLWMNHTCAPCVDGLTSFLHTRVCSCATDIADARTGESAPGSSNPQGARNPRLHDLAAPGATGLRAVRACEGDLSRCSASHLAVWKHSWERQGPGCTSLTPAVTWAVTHVCPRQQMLGSYLAVWKHSLDPGTCLLCPRSPSWTTRAPVRQHTRSGAGRSQYS